MLTASLLVVLFATVNGQKEGDACEDQYTNAAGVCTLIEQCETAKRDFQESGISPTYCSRRLFESSLVCCRDGLKIFETLATARTILETSTSAISPQYRKRLCEKKCDDYSSEVVHRVDYFLLLLEPQFISISVDKCDVRTASIPGNFAVPGEFPHVGAIGWSVNDKYVFKCGGSLISRRFVLTAASCKESQFNDDASSTKISKEPVIVRFGDQNLDDSVNDGAFAVDIRIQRFLLHPNYNSPRRYDDVGLIELARDVEAGSNIRPACLWARPNFSGYDRATVTGWNIINTEKTSKEQELEKASITILENENCKTLMNNFKNRNWPELSDTQLCAGELRRKWHSCMNEAGSPLQLVSKEDQCMFHLVGITSFGIQCWKSDIPTVYTRVTPYLDWIESIVWPDE